MRILIVNTDYPAFLEGLYAAHPALDAAPYADQLRVRNDSLFGSADFYSRNFVAQGHEAWDVHANNMAMQRAWAREQGGGAAPPSTGLQTLIDKTRPLTIRPPLRYLKPLLRPFILKVKAAPFATLGDQIRSYKPDVVLNQAMDEIPDGFLRELKPRIPLLVGQVAAPLNLQTAFPSYDLVVSSLPNFVEDFRKQGIPAVFSRLAFEASVLDRFPERERDIPFSFVGSLTEDHASRIRLLETLVENTPLEFWGRIAASLPKRSPIWSRYRGPAWGAEMYTLLARSRITLNHHIGVAAEYANNMRLFEATGMGTLLVTDRKSNLHEMFEAGKEIAVYDSPESCVATVRRFLADQAARASVARAGQARTLRDHTYAQRTREMAGIFAGILKDRLKVVKK